MELATDYRLTSIAFPCISTGVYGYPKQPAAAVAVRTVAGFLEQQVVNIEVTFCCFDEEARALHAAEIDSLSF